MLQPFFVAAMQSTGRQSAFRRVACGHVVICALLAAVVAQSPTRDAVTAAGYLLLCVGLVEGAALVGWRLTQMPKSQALEFLLTSPVQPRRLFLAEALVGISRFTLVQFAGLPALGALHFAGRLSFADLTPLMVLPWAWGIASGLLLTAWVYEPRAVRRVGEFIGLVGVLIYLTVGVVAAENLTVWLQQLPFVVGKALFEFVRFLHDMNPFGVVRYWFAPERVDRVAWARAEGLTLAAMLVALAAGARAACRLRGHFHDRHYKPIDSRRPAELERIGDTPLSWWAVRRVMEFSGRINLWLAGGFAVIYAAYTVAGDAWPPWMGRLVFQLFEKWGGVPAVISGLVVMAAVPAVFQYGLWDSTVQDRCARLELLLLTDLSPADYWNASLAASWRRGRGYLAAAAILWAALGISGRVPWPAVVSSAAAGVLLWGFSFAVGFRGFSTGRQTSGLASLLTLGTPLLLVLCVRANNPDLANLLPVGLVFTPLDPGLRPTWYAAYLLLTLGTVALTRFSLARCDGSLRAWYDRNQGLHAAG
jgi:hypothetical protein